MTANLDRAARGLKNVSDPWAHEVLVDVIAWAQGVEARRREAEREATPPSAGEGKEVSVGHRTRAYGQSSYDGDYCTEYGCGWQGPCGSGKAHERDTRPTLPPAPVQDDAAVEALVDVARVVLDLDDDDADVFRVALHEHFDRGAFPGYGPTGARGEAGEVGR